jgi:hypothetical protein
MRLTLNMQDTRMLWEQLAKRSWMHMKKCKNSNIILRILSMKQTRKTLKKSLIIIKESKTWQEQLNTIKTISPNLKKGLIKLMKNLRNLRKSDIERKNKLLLLHYTPKTQRRSNNSYNQLMQLKHISKKWPLRLPSTHLNFLMIPWMMLGERSTKRNLRGGLQTSWRLKETSRTRRVNTLDLLTNWLELNSFREKEKVLKKW